MKTVGGLRRTRYRGRDRTGLAGYLVATAYNLVRMANLTAWQADPKRVRQLCGWQWIREALKALPAATQVA